MRSCPECDGFVPLRLQQCPHCNHALPVPKGLSLRAKITTGLMASSAAMTLMACYGAPCGPDECGWDPEASTGGTPETCDMGATPEVLAASDLPVMVDGMLVAQSGADYGTCGGNGDEVVYEWTPPAAGNYRFSVNASADTVLYVRSPDASMGGTCGTELACNDDGTTGSNPDFEVNLTTDPVLVIVDGFSDTDGGAFTLSIEQL